MNLIAELHAMVDELAAFDRLDVPARDLGAAARQLTDDEAISVLAGAARLINGVERVRLVVAGIAAERSARERGYRGMAQTRGHRTPASLIQSITGVSRAEANRQVRLGESLLEKGPSPDCKTGRLEPAAPEDLGEKATDEAFPDTPWHEPLRAAMLGGALTPAQHDAILRGLGEPPLPHAGESVTIDGIVRVIAEVREVWRIAGEQLAAAAHEYPVEDLLREARRTRDLIHPEGAAERWAQRYEARSFRMWADDNGQYRAHLVLDDEGAAWLRSMIDAALRPRRGGPRFVTDQERRAAKTLIDDPRTNEQLEYDLVLAAVKAGSLATAERVFGARQPGVRMIIEKDAASRRDPFGRLLGVGRLEDRGDIVAGPVIDRTICAAGFQPIVVDSGGNPLQLGRELRLFSAKQKVALSVRDGGCLIPQCPMPASYCEAHHADHFARDQGRTDVDRGLLLCAFHHLLCHDEGWEIARDGLGDFVLHPPPGRGEPIELHSKSPLVLRHAS